MATNHAKPSSPGAGRIVRRLWRLDEDCGLNSIFPEYLREAAETWTAPRGSSAGGRGGRPARTRETFRVLWKLVDILDFGSLGLPSQKGWAKLKGASKASRDHARQNFVTVLTVLGVRSPVRRGAADWRVRCPMRNCSGVDTLEPVGNSCWRCSACMSDREEYRTFEELLQACGRSSEDAKREAQALIQAGLWWDPWEPDLADRKRRDKEGHPTIQERKIMGLVGELFRLWLKQFVPMAPEPPRGLSFLRQMYRARRQLTRSDARK